MPCGFGSPYQFRNVSAKIREVSKHLVDSIVAGSASQGVTWRAACLNVEIARHLVDFAQRFLSTKELRVNATESTLTTQANESASTTYGATLSWTRPDWMNLELDHACDL